MYIKCNILLLCLYFFESLFVTKKLDDLNIAQAKIKGGNLLLS